LRNGIFVGLASATVVDAGCPAEGQPEQDEVGGDKQKLLASDILSGYDDYDWSLTEPAESWTVAHSQSSKREAKIYTTPSSAKVDISRKLNLSERPRFVEEEGLYVGEMPWVPEKVKNTLENR